MCPDGYEIISGHRRKESCQLLGINEIPVIVREINDCAAVIAIIDSNLQREHIRISEKAFAYRMKLEAMKSQGKRNDLTSSQVGTKLINSNSKWTVQNWLGEDTRSQYGAIEDTTRVLIAQILQFVLGRSCKCF